MTRTLLSTTTNQLRMETLQTGEAALVTSSRAVRLRAETLFRLL